MAPAIARGFAILGKLLTDIVALAFLLVIRELVLVRDLMFLGCSFVLYSLALGPPLPPPAPVAKVFGSFLPAISVTVEMTQTTAMATRMPWMRTESAKPSPPSRCQSVRLGR